jgi:hypothetical protein
MRHLVILGGALLTVAVELSFFLIFRFRSKKFVLTCIVGNLATNLILNYVLWLLESQGSPYYLLALVSGEILAVVSETALYFWAAPGHPELIPLTVASNIFSFLFGLLYYYLLSVAQVAY